MTSFITRLFACIGIVVTGIAILGGLVFWHYMTMAPTEPDQVVLSLDFDRPIVEQMTPSPLDLAAHEEPQALLDILHAIDTARTDPHVLGLVARFGSEQPALAQAEEIRAAIARFQKAGKFAYAFGTSYGDFGDGNRAYYLASGFDEIWLQPVGSVSLTGVALESPFIKTALGRYGVSGDFLRREEYKSVMEMFTRDDFSPPVRANMQSMIDNLAGQIADGVAAGRKWDAPHVRDLMARGPYTASEALKLGLVTHIGYADDLKQHIKEKAGDDAQLAGIDDYLSYDDGGDAPTPKARVALIYGTGIIADRGSTTADVTGEDVMGADEVAGAFDDAADDKRIKAILFRIDSPGGSPSASETIRAALLHAQKAGKPVFVSMGDVAASGGYWVAMSADYIAAQPGTLTGSIGVVAGKFVISGLMEKFGVGYDEISTDPNAGLWSMAKEFTPDQRARMNVFLDETYRDFTDGVAKARKIAPEKMADLAKGRVFTGAQALKVGLVDDLGGYDVTLAALRKRLGLTPDDIMAVEQFPAPETISDRVLHFIKNLGFESAMVGSALGQWQKVQTSLGISTDALSMHQPVRAQLPYNVVHMRR